MPLPSYIALHCLAVAPSCFPPSSSGKFEQVNAATAARLLANQKEHVGPGKMQPGSTPLMADSRFRRMFEDPAYAIDEHGDEF